MDFGKSFTFMFEDPNWVAKLAIGGAILLVGTLFFWLLFIPIIVASAIILGYMVLTLRNVAEGSATPLPEWNDFGNLTVKGLYVIVGSIIWLLPVIILGCCLGLVNAALGNISAGSSQGSSGAQSLAALVSVCLSCLVSIISFVLGVTLYAPITRYALSNQLSVFWDVRGNANFIQQNLGNYIIALLLSIVASIVAGFGIIACVIGAFFTQFWAYLVTAHLYGQVARGGGFLVSQVPPPPMAPPPMEPLTPA